MDIENLEGCELDAAVAERVMGWTPIPDGLDPTIHNPYYKWLKPDGNKTPHINFSTDIAAAWRVVEKLEALSPTVTIRISNGDGDSCDVDILGDMFSNLNSVHVSIDGGLERAPEAISRAALRAVAADEETK